MDIDDAARRPFDIDNVTIERVRSVDEAELQRQSPKRSSGEVSDKRRDRLELDPGSTYPLNAVVDRIERELGGRFGAAPPTPYEPDAQLTERAAAERIVDRAASLIPDDPHRAGSFVQARDALSVGYEEAKAHLQSLDVLGRESQRQLDDTYRLARGLLDEFEARDRPLLPTEVEE